MIEICFYCTDFTAVSSYFYYWLKFMINNLIYQIKKKITISSILSGQQKKTQDIQFNIDFEKCSIS